MRSQEIRWTGTSGCQEKNENNLIIINRESCKEVIAESSRSEPRPALGCRSPLFARTEKADDMFDRFFNLPGNLLCICGPDGYFERLNSGWTALLGWTLEELSASPYIDFVHADDRAATLAEVSAISGSKDTIRFENRCRHKEGSYRSLQWNARSAPGTRRIYATALDVTRQQRQEREILDVADREKQRVGRDLHDGLCQSLAGIAALSSALSRKLDGTLADDLSAHAQEITRLLSEAIGDAGDIARGLDTSGLNAAGLDAALETLAGNVQHLFRVSCTYTADRPFPRQFPDVEGHLFRVAQEAVHNAITHGRVNRIEIVLTCKRDSGVLSIRDDGVGLPNAASRSDGLGLHTMAYRARVIGASLELRRRFERGTAVTCVFPLDAKADAQNKPDERQLSLGLVTQQ